MSAASYEERLMQVILGPHVSEKSTAVAERNKQVVFRVRRDARKQEIRRAVELLFEVEVTAVTVASMPGKAKRFGTNQGQRSALKKAYVRLAPGHDIDFVGSE